jgi:hypothetical protein
VEILLNDISTKRSPNLAPFDKISKSGDGGGSGGSFITKGRTWLAVFAEHVSEYDLFNVLTMYSLFCKAIVKFGWLWLAYKPNIKRYAFSFVWLVI